MRLWDLVSVLMGAISYGGEGKLIGTLIGAGIAL